MHQDSDSSQQTLTPEQIKALEFLWLVSKNLSDQKNATNLQLIPAPSKEIFCFQNIFPSFWDENQRATQDSLKQVLKLLHIFNLLSFSTSIELLHTIPTPIYTPSFNPF